MITQEELKANLRYDSETGDFTWLKQVGSRVSVGTIAGCKTRYGYVSIRVLGGTYLAHRLAWLYTYGEMPKMHIDHINGVKDDNRLCNLREASKSENGFNRDKPRTNKTGYKGVSLCGCIKNPYVSQIGVNGKSIRLGRFPTAELAHEAYREAAKKYHGEFVWVA